MKRLLYVIFVLALAPAAWAFQDARDKPKPDTPEKPAEQFKALVDEFNKTRMEIANKYRAAKDDAEREKILEAYYAVPKTYLGKFVAFAEKNGKDPVAAKALAWIITNSQGTPEADKAVDGIVKDHIDSPEMNTLLQQAAYSGPSAAMEKLVRAAMEKSKDKDKQGQATFALAKMLGSKVELISSLKSADADTIKRSESFYGKDVVARLKDTDPATLSKEAEELLEQVVAKYADVKANRGTLGDAAKSELFELRNLAIGKVAPEIDGEDTDGKPMKLSDYRGKVVVLDFWGHW